MLLAHLLDGDLARRQQPSCFQS